jgi:hypothetical protein
MLELILVIRVSFATGYGVRRRVSRRRRREARKRYYERPAILKPDSHAQDRDCDTATGKEPTIRELHERLRRLEDRIFGARLETETFCDEAQSEFAATHRLLERKFEEAEHGNNNGASNDGPAGACRNLRWTTVKSKITKNQTADTGP